VHARPEQAQAARLLTQEQRAARGIDDRGGTHQILRAYGTQLAYHGRSITPVVPVDFWRGYPRAGATEAYVDSSDELKQATSRRRLHRRFGCEIDRPA